MTSVGHRRGEGALRLDERLEEETAWRRTATARAGPLVAVTGMGVVTSLGQGKEDNWAALDRRPLRHPPHHALPDRGPAHHHRRHGRLRRGRAFVAPMLSERLADARGRGSGRPAGHRPAGDFPGALFIAVPPVEMEWPQREALARGVRRERRASPTATSSRPPRTGRFKDWHDLFMFGTVADRIADRFGTKGSPISLSTACSSGATAIQLGVEAIRRGETEAALCIGTDGSVNPESLIRFSLLSALSTQNDPPEGAGEAVLQEPRRLRHGRGRRRRWCWRTPRARGRAARRSSATCSAAARRATASTARARARTARPIIAAIRERSPMPGSRRTTSTTSTPTAPARPRTTRWRRWAASRCSASA